MSHSTKHMLIEIPQSKSQRQHPAQALTVVVLLLTFLVAAKAQEASSQQASSTADNSDVIRVSTDLVQTGISVFDKKGKVPPNLRREDFELRVDGQLQAVSFFELVTAGSAKDKQTADKSPLRTGSAPTSEPARVSVGRTVIFLLDDFHLSPESISRTRSMLLKFIDEMDTRDQVLIASTSGQIGFLQQLTSNKETLRAAVARLKFRATSMFDGERPQMSIEQAFAIEGNDPDVLNHFVAISMSTLFVGLAKTNISRAAIAAEQLVRSRARRIVAQADSLTTFTLSALENIVRSAANVKGRKLAIFISDGFQYDANNTDAQVRFERISDAALRAGVVIYSIGAGGLSTSFPDASSDEASVSGTEAGRVLGGDVARQAPLVSAAAVTGGRAFLNSNDPLRGLKRALGETSEYYLLGWRPDPSLLKTKKFHKVAVIVKNHPELSVAVQRGFFSEDLAKADSARAKAIADPSGFPLQELVSAIRDAYSRTPLPTFLTAGYFDDPKRGQVLTILVQIPVEDLTGSSDTKGQSQFIDIAGVIFTEGGKPEGTFLNRLPVANRSSEARPNDAHHVVYLNQLVIKPGLYQVRVAARDRAGKIGRASQWIEVPKLSKGQLALSSLVIGESGSGSETARPGEMFAKAQLKIDNRFERHSKLRLFTYLYNAAWSTGESPAPDIEVQTQILNDNDQLISSHNQRPAMDGITDPKRIPYAEDISLALAPGQYLLRVTATDRIAKTTASQEVRFQIE